MIASCIQAPPPPPLPTLSRRGRLEWRATARGRPSTRKRVGPIPVYRNPSEGKNRVTADRWAETGEELGKNGRKKYENNLFSLVEMIQWERGKLFKKKHTLLDTFTELTVLPPIIELKQGFSHFPIIYYRCSDRRDSNVKIERVRRLFR